MKMVCVKSAKDIMHLICQFENQKARKCFDGMTGEKGSQTADVQSFSVRESGCTKKRDEKQGNYAKI